jgi:hypothetical protein
MKAMTRVKCLTLLAAAGAMTMFATLGCRNTPIDTSEYARGPAPLQMPSPAPQAGDTYEDSLTGGQIFTMYCNGCHNVRSLAERPFASYKNVVAHMRSRANLTGKETAKLLEWMRRWHDVPPPVAEVEPSPKRFVFSQPIVELQPQGEPAANAPSPARPGAPASPAVAPMP